MGGKKKFIDKKKSATFQLLARDSSEPNHDHTPGSDRIFVRVDNNHYSFDTFGDDDPNNGSGTGCFDADPNSIFADAPKDYDDGNDDHRGLGNLVRSQEVTGAEAPLPEHVRMQILELGFPDDGYNYLLHMREIKNTGGGSSFYPNPKAKLEQLPLDVKAYDASRVSVSEVNGDLNDQFLYSVASKAVNVRVQKAIDPEVDAMLDDSDLSRFGSDVEDLEEDFVVQANLPEAGEDITTEKKFNLVEESEKSKESGFMIPCNQKISADLISMAEKGESSGVENPRVRRVLDEQFDLLVSREYGTDDDGDSHDAEDDYGDSHYAEDDDGDSHYAEDDDYVARDDEYLAEKLQHALGDQIKGVVELDEAYMAPGDLLKSNKISASKELLDSTAVVIRRCAEYAEQYQNEDDDKDVVLVEESSDESEVWDCETIVSTFSNLDNHPGKIEAPEVTRKKKLAETVSGALSSSNYVITLKGKEKLPVDFLPRARKPTSETVKAVGSLRTEQQKRKQHGQESKEEKKERKNAVKEERREARRVKKEMKGLYHGEAQRAQRVAAISGPSSIHLM